jgi:hypothetical protein
MIEEEEIMKTKLQQINKEKLNLEEHLQNLEIKKDEFVSETLTQTFAVAMMIGGKKKSLSTFILISLSFLHFNFSLSQYRLWKYEDLLLEGVSNRSTLRDYQQD